MTLDKWQSLIKETQVTGSGNLTCSQEEFLLVEREVGIRFPAGYQEFCEVFGPGILGGFIQLDCPCFLGKRVDRRSIWRLNGLKAELLWERECQASGEQVNGAKLTLVETLLNNAFVFGSNPNGHQILWDLGSYQESDQSCDIYLVPSDELEQTTLVGRDFYEFVRDFCLGHKADDVLPARINFSEEMTGRNFYKFSQEMLKEGLPPKT